MQVPVRATNIKSVRCLKPMIISNAIYILEHTIRENEATKDTGYTHVVYLH